ncbi:MAG: fibronectin type III domain-containing protein, partial [Lachnospiraceae bacterium]|nr:fibronectin type III domain-containing protein [Lachnospiraceae bacterium]
TPAQVTVKKAEPGASSLTISWTPLTKDCTGYEIQVSTDKDFKNASTYTASGASASSHIINGLTATTVYYYRIRAINGTVTGSWSEGQSVKTTAVVKTPTATPTPAPAKGDKIEYSIGETAHTFRSSSTLYLFEVKNGDWAGRKKVPAENWKITEKDIDVKSATLTPTKDGGCILNVSIGTNPFTENYVNVSCTYKGKTYTGAAYFDEIMLQDSAELAQDLYNEVVPVLPIN